MLTRLRAYVTGLLRRGAIDVEVDEELRFHVEMETQANIARGMTPTEARRVALRDIGGVTQTRESTREVRRIAVVDTLVRDVRYALRSMRRNPTFTTVSVVTLALGIGANTAVFTLFDQLLLRPLPVKEPDALVLVSANWIPRFTGSSAGGSYRRPDGKQVHLVNFRLFSDLAAKVPAFAESFAVMPRSYPVLIGDRPNDLAGQLVSSNYFTALGVKAAAGRLLSETDNRAAAPPVAVITHGFWQRQFGGQASVIGRVMRLAGHPVTIVGVAEAGFAGFGRRGAGQTIDFFVPLELYDLLKDPKQSLTLRGELSHLEMFARLRTGISIAQAQVVGEAVYQQLLTDAVGGRQKELEESDRRALRILAHSVPGQKFDLSRHLTLYPAGYGLSSQSMVSPQLLRALQVLMVMAALLLLIAATNLANLIVARGVAARREVVIRLALGASRTRLLASRLVDNLLVAAAAAVGSLLVAKWLADVLLIILPVGPDQSGVRTMPDRRMVLVTMAVALGTGLFVWLTSSLQITRRSTLPALSDTGLGGVSTRPLRFRRGLLALQTALSLALLCAASMFAHSLLNLVSIDPGFRVAGLTTFMLRPSGDGASSKPLVPLVRDTLDAFAGRADVSSAVATTQLPLMGTGGTNVVGGDVPVNAENAVMAAEVRVTPGYFRAIELPFIQGRDFNDGDTAQGERVAVINESLARELFGRRNPIGERIGLQYMALDRTVVGIVRDTKESLRRPPEPTMFLPLAQEDGLGMTVVVRTKSGAPLEIPTVQAVVNRIDPTAAVSDLATMERRIADMLSRDRILALLSSAFAGLAALLCGLGLFGMMNFHVAARQRELGIRLVLGAEHRAIRWSVMREAVLVILVGAPIGLAGYVASSRAVGSVLFDLSPTDVPTVAAAAGMLLLVGLAASIVPARRATRLDPAEVLREQ